MTVDFIQRKRSKREAKKTRALSRKDADGKRIRTKRGVKRQLRGMCSSAPPLPPSLKEEDEREEAARRSAKRKAERERMAAKALRKKLKAKARGERVDDDDDEEGGDVDDAGDDDDDGTPSRPSSSSSSVPDYFMDAMKSIGHRRTTPVQRRCWPVACSGSDLLAIAPPGSGKTLAFLLPAIETALQDQRENPKAGKKRPGAPAVLVVAPTRELTLQIAGVCNKLKKAVPVRAVPVYGGASQEDQEEALTQSTSHALLVIGTPGRLLAVLESGALQLDRCKMLVLDEADRMLALGFEEQLKAIRSVLPSDGRQTLLFSATFPKAVRAIGKTWLGDEYETVKIDSEKAALPEGEEQQQAHMATVEQTVHVCAEHKKSRKLMKYITKLRAADGRARSRVLVFANRIKTVQFIADLCKRHNEKVSTLYGTMKQERRDQALKDFKAGKTPVLIATDVAGRGLDIAGLEYVVNWDFPGSIEQYRHRVGRAGRQGKKGAALSFFTRKFTPLAEDLIDLLKKGGHFVDPNLQILAKVAAALPKPSGKQVMNADRYDEPADEQGELERDDDDGDEKVGGGGGAGDDDNVDEPEPEEDEEDEDDEDAADARKSTKSRAGWWNNDKGGRGKVFTKTRKGDIVYAAPGSRKVSVGPGSDELGNRKKKQKARR